MSLSEQSLGSRLGLLPETIIDGKYRRFDWWSAAPTAAPASFEPGGERMRGRPSSNAQPRGPARWPHIAPPVHTAKTCRRAGFFVCVDRTGYDPVASRMPCARSTK